MKVLSCDKFELIGSFRGRATAVMLSVTFGARPSVKRERRHQQRSESRPSFALGSKKSDDTLLR